MDESEVLVSVFIPWSRPLEFVEAYKQSRRRDDDIAIVNACFRVRLDPATQCVAEASLAYGGMAPFSVCAKATEQFLVGKKWTQVSRMAWYSPTVRCSTHTT